MNSAIYPLCTDDDSKITVLDYILTQRVDFNVGDPDDDPVKAAERHLESMGIPT